MSQAISQYDALWQSFRTRRRTLRTRTGMDALAGRVWTKLRHVGQGTSRWMRLARQADRLQQQCHVLTDADLDSRLASTRESFARGHADTPALVEALAVLREVARRELGLEPYVVQLAGAAALHHGQIVQMVTGEGKTLSSVIAAVLLAWSKPGVHVVTANDYLAQRDAAGMRPVYQRVNVSVGLVVPATSQPARAAEYRKSVVYTTQKDLVGDWLRDQLALKGAKDTVTERLTAPLIPGQPVQTPILIPGLHACIVDEADVVLIDQAVTPLIMSMLGHTTEPAQTYVRADELAQQVEQGADYELDLRHRRVELTDAGKQKLGESMADNDRGTWRSARRRHELVTRALVARHCMSRGDQYDIVDGRVVLVDEFTGRFMPDRRMEQGLHQALEAKEQLDITEPSQSVASLSFQRFFRSYPHLCGMSGTAAGGRPEFEQVYGVPVRIIPTHKPVRRTRQRPQVLPNQERKLEAIVGQVRNLHATGRPVLIGTRSLEASQTLSQMLGNAGLPNHQVLNAVEHEHEAQIIAQAGQLGAITVATNMAGRGTDILLGTGVADFGGLHVILTERHEARRIDEQLIGRAGRQGDCGSAQVFHSLEDPLLAKHAPALLPYGKWRKARRIGPLGAALVRGLFWFSQCLAERRAFEARKNVLQRDNWLDRAVPSL